MKAEVIFVFYIPDRHLDSEGIRGAAALYDRQIAERKANGVYLVEIPSAAMRFGQLRIIRGKNDVQATHGEAGVGVYLITHHGMFAPEFGGIPAARMADLIAGFVQDAEVGALTKVALLVCHAGTGVGARNAKKAIGHHMRQAFEDSLLVKFCHELQRNRETPKLAGWDKFVTVCFADHPAINRIEHQDWGRKALSTYQAQKLTDKDRLEHKKVIQWSGEAGKNPITVLRLNGWTQRV
jgi:hypothetical protein